jgi:hypothetical protein
VPVAGDALPNRNTNTSTKVIGISSTSSCWSGGCLSFRRLRQASVRPWRAARAWFIAPPWLSSLGGRPGPGCRRAGRPRHRHHAAIAALGRDGAGHLRHDRGDRIEPDALGRTDVEGPAAAGQRRYPNLQRAISSGGDLDNDAAFEFTLNFILDAVAAGLPSSDAE